MARKAKYTEETKPQVLHSYCPRNLYDKFTDAMVKHGIGESDLLNKCVQSALPLLTQSLPVLSLEDQDKFKAALEAKKYKHKKK